MGLRLFCERNEEADIPETSRNKLVYVGKHLLEYGRKRTEKEIEEFWQSEKGKQLIEKNKLED